MGKFNKKSIIIEFNGLPGSGKTTISNFLKEMIEREIKVEVTKRYVRRKWHRNVYSMVLSPQYFRLIKLLNRLSTSFPEKRKLYKRLLIPSYSRKYKDFLSTHEQGVLLIDQGIVQALISFAHQDELPHSNLIMEILSESGINTLPLVIVNCQIDVETSASRIKNRPSNGCRVEKMDNTGMLQTLTTQSNNINYLRFLICSNNPKPIIVDVDTNEDPKKNAKKIIKEVEKYINEVIG